MKFKTLVGRAFGRLLVLSRGENKGQHTTYLCACECGQQVTVRAQSLRRGETTSCGCLRRERQAALRTTHGRYATPTYRSWASMIARCTNKKHRQFHDYGGRGITVCERWKSFINFLADMGERPAERTLDRVDPDGNYEPGNCRWATALEQRHNRRSQTRSVSHAE